MGPTCQNGTVSGVPGLPLQDTKLQLKQPKLQPKSVILENSISLAKLERTIHSVAVLTHTIIYLKSQKSQTRSHEYSLQNR